MKIGYGINNCSFTFEENDKYAGKEVCIYGEPRRGKKTQALLFCQYDEIVWFVPFDGKDSKNGVLKIPVEDDIKAELIDYIGEKASKQGLSLGYYEVKGINKVK